MERRTQQKILRVVLYPQRLINGIYRYNWTVWSIPFWDNLLPTGLQNMET